jgi:hypothetical protein
MVLKMSILIASARNKMALNSVAARHFPGYKYLLHSLLGTIPHFYGSSISRLWFSSFAPCFPTMEGKKVIKRECSPSAEGSSVANDAKTAPPTPSGTPSPPGSPTEVSSRHPRSSVLEQGGPSGNAPVIDLSSSSDEKDSIADTFRDFEIAKRLYGELNSDLLGSSGDGNVIILSDSDEEKEEAHEEKSVGTEDEVASAAINPVSTTSADDTGTTVEKSSTPATSPVDVDDDPRVKPNDNSDGLAPGSKMEEGSDGGDEADSP